jgi:hypothetical protein
MARNIAMTDAYSSSRRERKKVEMLFAHLKRIRRLDCLRLRGPRGTHDELLFAATAQNLRKLANLIPAPQRLIVTSRDKAGHPLLRSIWKGRSNCCVSR